MAIREFKPTGIYLVKAPTVYRTRHGGHVVASHIKAPSDYKPLYVCDTKEEAEQMRLLLELKRESVEAIERAYEKLLNEVVTQ